LAVVAAPADGAAWKRDPGAWSTRATLTGDIRHNVARVAVAVGDARSATPSMPLCGSAGSA
jgi:hypothetical protein